MFELNMEIVWWVLVIGLFILSYVGLILPGIPDVPLMFGGFLIYHFFIDSSVLAWWFWVTVILLMLLMMAVDYFSGGIAARKFGGSRLSMIVAPIAAIALIWLPFGIVVGPFVSVLIVELLQRRGIVDSLKIAVSTVIGFISGFVVKVIALTGTKVWFFVLI